MGKTIIFLCENFSFAHKVFLHETEHNIGSKTTGSLDFRLELSEPYFDSSLKWVNMKSEFKTGSYFSSEIF